jgi:hypothetical protein
MSGSGRHPNQGLQNHHHISHDRTALHVLEIQTNLGGHDLIDVRQFRCARGGQLDLA